MLTLTCVLFSLAQEMRFDARKLFSRGHDVDAEGAGGDAAVMAGAKSALFSNVMKKNLVENIVPVAVELKHHLEAVHSPLLGKLIRFLQRIIREHRSEMEDLLVGNRELANELEYDFRMEEAREKAAASVLSSIGGRDGALMSPGVVAFQSPNVASPAFSRLRPMTPRLQNGHTPSDHFTFSHITSPSTIISPRLRSHRKRVLRSRDAEDGSVASNPGSRIESPSLSILRMTSPNAIANRATPRVRRSAKGSAHDSLKKASSSEDRHAHDIGDVDDVDSPVALGSLAGMEVDQDGGEEEEDPLWDVSL
jgi:hypothetical protein